MSRQSPFETTRLPDLPPTARLKLTVGRWSSFLRRVYPGILIGAGLCLLLWCAALLFTPAPARPAPVFIGERAQLLSAPTPALVVPTATALPSVTVSASWSPGGPTYGTITLDSTVQLVETYRGWARFRTAHMTTDLWAPLAELAPVLDRAQLAVAPEIAPTAAPLPPPPPRQPDPVQFAAPISQPATQEVSDLQPVPPEGGEVVLRDEPGRFEAIYVQPIWATPFPTPYFGPRGGGGGSWDD